MSNKECIRCAGCGDNPDTLNCKNKFCEVFAKQYKTDIESEYAEMRKNLHKLLETAYPTQFINYNLDVKYTQAQMDKAIENAFNAAREGSTFTVYESKLLSEKVIYQTAADYIKTLNQ